VHLSGLLCHVNGSFYLNTGMARQKPINGVLKLAWTDIVTTRVMLQLFPNENKQILVIRSVLHFNYNSTTLFWQQNLVLVSTHVKG